MEYTSVEGWLSEENSNSAILAMVPIKFVEAAKVEVSCMPVPCSWTIDTTLLELT